MHAEPRFERAAFTLRRLRPQDARVVLDFQLRNFQHFAPTSPRRPPEFSTEAFWAERIAIGQRNFDEDRACTLYLFEGAGRAVGMVNLMNFVRGALQSCDLGYAIDLRHQGTGLMFWAVSQALRYAFDVLNLHRIQANHLPDNQRSARLLARLGFQREGYAPKFLLIDGEWRDHVCNALRNDDWRPAPGEEFVLSDLRPQPK
ncbi:MAG TPA: GNAT family N-acetyltransferase [Polyangiales bacterium]